MISKDKLTGRNSSTGKPKIRYAVVGLGYIAQVAVLPAFAKANRQAQTKEALAKLGITIANAEVRSVMPSLSQHSGASFCCRKIS